MNFCDRSSRNHLINYYSKRKYCENTLDYLSNSNKLVNKNMFKDKFRVHFSQYEINFGKTKNEGISVTNDKNGYLTWYSRISNFNDYDDSNKVYVEDI